MNISVTVEQFLDHLNEYKIPLCLYKYRDIESVKKIISNNSLLFSSALDFNDPFDCQVLIRTDLKKNQLKNFMRKEIDKPGMSNNKIKEIVKSCKKDKSSFKSLLRTEIKQNINDSGICCFSKNNDNILMWSHYAQNHSGVCLKFDLKKDIVFFTYPFPVNYKADFPTINVITDHNWPITSVVSKHEGWRYEEEVRVVKIDNKGLFAFKKDALIEVIFGYRTEKKEVNEIKQLITEYGYPNVNYKSVSIVKGKYKLEIKQCDI